jgi:uncharacterized membrane protein YbhN (UPF0104 family)
VARVGGGPIIEYRLLVRVVAVGFGAFVLATGAGGLAVDWWALRRAGAEPHEAARRVLALNTLQWASLSAGAWIAALAVLAGAGNEAPLGATLAWLVLVPACVLAAAWVSAPARAPRLTDLERGGRIRDAFADAVAGVVLVRMLILRPREHLAGVLGFPAYWCGHMACLWAGLRAFEVRIGVASLVLAFATGYVASALPLPAGGAGGVDAAMAFSLHMVGVPLSAALLGVIAYRIFSFWLPIVPALIALPGLGRLRDELPASVRGPDDEAAAAARG